MQVYIPWAGHITHWGQKFDLNRYPLSLWLTVAFQNFSLNYIFSFHFFRHVNSDLYWVQNVNSLGAEAHNPLEAEF